MHTKKQKNDSTVSKTYIIEILLKPGDWGGSILVYSLFLVTWSARLS